MLNSRRNYSSQTRIVVIMSEIIVQAASVKMRLEEVAKQAAALAAGLQNASPGEKDAPNASIQYLTAMADALAELTEDCDELIHPGAAPPSDSPSGKPGM